MSGRRQPAPVPHKHEVLWPGGDPDTTARDTPTTRRRDFLIPRESGPVPGTVWIPAAAPTLTPAPTSTPEPPSPPLPGPLPLVLLSHGGSGTRHSTRVTQMAALLTRSGLAAAAIDGPYHGERVAKPLTPAEYQSRIAAEGIGTVLDRTAGDWRATRDVLVEAGIADPERLAYFGLSFGTRYGIAAAAALGSGSEPGLRCAVLGKFGVQESPDLHPGLHAPQRTLRDAARIAAPVLFHMQWDDELFPRAGQLELFDSFPSPAKELHAFPGGHRHTPDHAPLLWHDFLFRHLAPGPPK